MLLCSFPLFWRLKRSTSSSVSTAMSKSVSRRFLFVVRPEDLPQAASGSLRSGILTERFVKRAVRGLRASSVSVIALLTRLPVSPHLGVSISLAAYVDLMLVESAGRSSEINEQHRRASMLKAKIFVVESQAAKQMGGRRLKECMCWVKIKQNASMAGDATEISWHPRRT